MKFDKNSLKTIGGNILLVILIATVIVFTVVVAKKILSEDSPNKKDITYSAKMVIDELQKSERKVVSTILQIQKDIKYIKESCVKR